LLGKEYSFELMVLWLGGKMSKAKQIVLWVVSVPLAATFLFAGGFKLLHADQIRAAFVQFGLPARLALFIGVCEVCGAIGLLIPRLAALAAAGLSIIMIGAVVLTAIHHQFPIAGSNLVILVLLLVVARARLKSAKS
jgi:putative oxidoreductase